MRKFILGAAFVFAAIVAFLPGPGCARAPLPQKGGGAAAKLAGIRPGPETPPSAPETTATLAQPENPAATSTQSLERQESRQTVAPVPSVRITETPTEAGVIRVTEQFGTPTVLTHTVTEKSATALGGSWKDTAREVAAALKGTVGVRVVGCGLIVAGLACFHPTLRTGLGAGKSLPFLTIAAGFGLVFGSQYVAQHPLALLAVAVGLVVAFLLVRASHKEGVADAARRI